MSFLKASTKEQYALRLAIRLSDSYFNQIPISLKEAAEKEHLSVKYLEELIVPFKKQKFVKSVNGRAGGYIFVKDPKQVSVKDIIWLINNQPSLTICASGENICPLNDTCLAKNVWQKVQKEMEKTLSNMKLTDFK